MPPEIDSHAKLAVQRFLDSQIEKKTEKEVKQLQKAQESSDADKIAQLTANIAEVEAKHQAITWLELATSKMAKQLSFGTHIAKGVHPDAKGDNVSFQGDNHLAKTLVGSHSINRSYLDANGNAAALPLAAFFAFELGEGSTIGDLILQDNAEFIASLSSDAQTAHNYHQIFKQALQNSITTPVTHERNKQTLWPLGNDEKEGEQVQYHTIIPLYPSVLTHEVYQRINHIKFSEESKIARNNRFEEKSPQVAYADILDLAVVQLGGTKPQNVSSLMSKQGGRNYLLPSMPPAFHQNNSFFRRVSSFKISKFATTIFSKKLEYPARHALEQVFWVIKNKQNNVEIRNARKFALDEILHIVFSIAKGIQQNYTAGWSKDFSLDYNQQLWLDAGRAQIEGEEQFALDREEKDWHEQIFAQFASWLNSVIKRKFPQIKYDIGDSEYIEWEREIEAMAKQYARVGKGVFE